MRIGLSSYAYRYATAGERPGGEGPMGPVEMLERAKGLGLDVVQFCDNLPLHRLSEGDLDDLCRTAERLGVAVEVGTSGLDVAALRRYVEIARRVRSRALRLVLETADPAAAERVLCDLLRDVRAAGLTLALENHFDLPGPALAALVRRLGDPAVAVCLDTANSVGLVERPEETIAALAPLAVQAHVKDYLVERAPIGYHITGRPLGHGWLDIPAAIAALRDAGRDPDLYVEQWMDPADTLPETLAKEEAWIAESAAVLRRLSGGHA